MFVSCTSSIAPCWSGRWSAFTQKNGSKLFFFNIRSSFIHKCRISKRVPDTSRKYFSAVKNFIYMLIISNHVAVPWMLVSCAMGPGRWPLQQHGTPTANLFSSPQITIYNNSINNLRESTAYHSVCSLHAWNMVNLSLIAGTPLLQLNKFL